MNISTVQSKGGVNKSAIAANLSVWLHQKGHLVACVDLDGGEFANQSLTTAVGQAAPEIPIFRADTAADVAALFPSLAQDFHFIIADAPGGFQHTAETNLELLRHTDFALIPVTPQFGNISPLPVVERVIGDARRDNPLLEARVVVSSVDGRTRAGKDIAGTLKTIEALTPNIPVMRQTVRVDVGAFETAAQNGTVVVSGPRSNARDDYDSLFGELLSDMLVSIHRQDQRQAPRTKNREEEHAQEAVHG
ncbi:ParA family protein [Pirellulales bacterium]|nr:ParA family protein [Pirellulales bacterium]